MMDCMSDAFILTKAECMGLTRAVLVEISW